MKSKILIQWTLCIAIIIGFIGCENWTEPSPVILDETLFSSLTPEEEKALIEYKNSDHKIFFAWMNYSPATPSMQTRLRGIPDSLDIVSFFTGYVNNEQNREDVKFLQEHRGTKVILTMWPEHYFSRYATGANDVDSMKVYAQNLVDSIYTWGLDGFDLDYEPHFGGDVYNETMMRTFIDVMSQYFGPKCKDEYKINGKHKLLIVDGEWLDKEYADRFDYFIGQAYNAQSEWALEDRLLDGWSDYGKGFPNEKRIFCEWTSQVGNPFGHGGVTYKYKNETIPSLWGMAHFAVDKGIAGCGSYVLQFAYEEDYYHARQAIQIMNGKKSEQNNNKE